MTYDSPYFGWIVPLEWQEWQEPADEDDEIGYEPDESPDDGPYLDRN